MYAKSCRFPRQSHADILGYSQKLVCTVCKFNKIDTLHSIKFIWSDHTRYKQELWRDIKVAWRAILYLLVSSKISLLDFNLLNFLLTSALLCGAFENPPQQFFSICCSCGSGHSCMVASLLLLPFPSSTFPLSSSSSPSSSSPTSFALSSFSASILSSSYYAPCFFSLLLFGELFSIYFSCWIPSFVLLLLSVLLFSPTALPFYLPFLSPLHFSFSKFISFFCILPIFLIFCPMCVSYLIFFYFPRVSCYFSSVSFYFFYFI